jgi:hypothetical protein
MIGQKVRIYRNLNNGMIGILHNGKRFYCTSITLKQCKSVVSLATQSRIKTNFEATGKRERNVHAYIEGVVVSIDDHSPSSIEALKGRRVSYNPFKGSDFYTVDDQKAWTGSDMVSAISLGKKDKPMITVAH